MSHLRKIIVTAVASIYFIGIGWAQDMMTLKRAAEKGNPKAMYLLAKKLDEIGEYKQAYIMLVKAKSKGHARAIGMLASYLEFRVRSFDEQTLGGREIIDYHEWEAFEHYQMAARRGDPQAMGRIGYYYLKDQSLNLPSRIRNNYKKICETKKISKIPGSVGYYQGGSWNVDKDERKAFSWYMRGAKKGDAECLYQVAFFYKNGTGVKDNSEKFIEFLSASAKKDYVPAMLTLSNIYRIGYPLDKDEAKADSWLVAALKESPSNRDLSVIFNSEEALKSMVKAYKDGVGEIKPDENKASYWEGELRNYEYRKNRPSTYRTVYGRDSNKSYY